MKAFLLFVAFLQISTRLIGSQIQAELPEVPTYTVNVEAVDIQIKYNTRDPYYKQRTGSFYETDYLGFSAKRLFDLTDLEPRKRVGAPQIIRSFIYDWLNYKVRDDGNITQEHHDNCVNLMNSRFKQLLTPIQYKIYEVWRDDKTGEANTLHFLIHYDAKGEREKALKSK